MRSLADWILEKGIDNINVSMLDERSRRSVLVEAGEKLLRMGKPKEGVKALVMSGDQKKMIEVGEELLAKKDLINSCTVLEPTGHAELLGELGSRALNEGLYETALRAFKACKNDEMVKFVEENFFYW